MDLRTDMTGGKVIAKVNANIFITEEKLEQMLKSMSPEQRMYFNNEEGKEVLINELIDMELIYVDAINRHLDKSPAFEAMLKEAKRDLLKQFAVRALLDEVVVSDKEVKNYYESNQENYQSGEKVTASHILVKTLEKARQIKQKLNQNESFEELAKNFSVCPSAAEGGKLGTFEKGKMVKEFEEAAFAMEPMDISEPVQTAFGYHIIKVEEREYGRTLTLDEVKNVIKGQLEKERRNKLYLSRLDEIKKSVLVERFS